MQNTSKDNQIKKWLENLERESWQLELIVSAFTIFLLIQATQLLGEKITYFRYNFSIQDINAFIFILIQLLNIAIRTLITFLIIHLLIRGFWIGTIGLRSVQKEVDYEKLNYSEFFTEKLKKRVMSVDALAVKLDQVSSVIFSIAFLVISMIISFGIYFLYVGAFTYFLSQVSDELNGLLGKILFIIFFLFLLLSILASFIYLIDYITLGFFKKWRITSRTYYVIYRFYGFLTLSAISRSIYYYLISHFSKARIRIIVILFIGLAIISASIMYTPFQFYPLDDNDYVMDANFYDDLRPSDDYIKQASVPSQIIKDEYFKLFLRYNPSDNQAIRALCDDYKPILNDGFNFSISARIDSMGLSINPKDYSVENNEALLICISKIYKISIGDSLLNKPDFFFYSHPAKNQKGIVAILPKDILKQGKNYISLEKYKISTLDTGYQVLAKFPVWAE